MLNQLKNDKVIAIVRGITAEQADAVAEALYEGGVRFIEVTLNTEGALNMIESWRKRYDKEMFVGAGTVLTREQAEQATQAGAQYLITPNIDDEVIQFAVQAEIDIYPGAMTPSEVARAWKLGAQAVKVFPAGSLGSSYFKELQGPLSHIPLIATGGIHVDNMRAYYEAGACAFGIGGHLVRKDLIAANQFDELKELAASFVKEAGRLSAT